MPVGEALFEEFSSLEGRVRRRLTLYRLTAEGAIVLDAKTVLDTFTPLPDDAHEIRVVSSETPATRALARVQGCRNRRQ